MKTKPSAIKSLLAAALAASCLASYAAAPQKREMKFEKLRKEFADPPRAFRPAPLWVWNTQVTRADIDRMLGDFKAQGFGGAVGEADVLVAGLAQSAADDGAGELGVVHHQDAEMGVGH